MRCIIWRNVYEAFFFSSQLSSFLTRAGVVVIEMKWTVNLKRTNAKEDSVAPSASTSLETSRH